MKYQELLNILKTEKYVAIIFSNNKNYNSVNLGNTINDFLKNNKLKIYHFDYIENKDIARNFPINKFPTLFVYKKNKELLKKDDFQHRIDVAKFADEFSKIIKK